MKKSYHLFSPSQLSLELSHPFRFTCSIFLYSLFPLVETLIHSRHWSQHAFSPHKTIKTRSFLFFTKREMCPLVPGCLGECRWWFLPTMAWMKGEITDHGQQGKGQMYTFQNQHEMVFIAYNVWCWYRKCSTAFPPWQDWLLSWEWGC